jgi:Cys-rich protein (TIGR04453 family)
VWMATLVLVMATHHSRIVMRVLLAFLLATAACGNQSPTPDRPAPASTAPPSSQAPARPPADAAPPLEDCAEACTEIAVCWEEENPGREYNQGGNCTSACESSTPEEKKAFFGCVEKGRSECAKMVACG